MSALQELDWLYRPDGAVLRLRKWQTGRPIIFMIHGFGDGGFVWNNFAKGTAAFGALAALDLRGHGDSAFSQNGHYPLKMHVDDVRFALDTLNANDVVLIGHSLGAAVAIGVGALLGRRLRGLVLVEGGPFLKHAALAFIREEFNRQPWRYSSIAHYAHLLEHRVPLAGPALCVELAQEALKPTGHGDFVLKCDPALTRAENVIDDEMLWSNLRRLSCQILLLRGISSSVLPLTVAQKINDELPSCRMRTIARAGHAVLLENPREFAAITHEFLAELMSPSNRLESVG